jgi:F-type H+-transporting ATPase subunit epsilon
VGDGFVQITGQRVAILTDMAVRAEGIDEAKVEEARRRAEARLAEHLDDEEAAMIHAALAHSLALLKVKRRNRP